MTVLRIYFTLTQYHYKLTKNNSVNIKLSNSKLNKFKSGIKNGTEVTINLLSDVIGDSNDKTYTA